MRLSIVIVSYNSWHVLQPCLASVYRETKGFPFEVIVVDNASTDGSAEQIEKAFPQVTLVQSEYNRGFAAANNLGFAVARGEFLLMLNPDTVVLDQAIPRTVQFLNANPAVGVAACRLLFPDGSLQQSLYSFPSVWNLFCEASFLGTLFPHSRLFGNYTLTNFDYRTTRRVDAACGAYLMIRREVFERIGMLDEQFYMYSEEIDFCFRAQKAGYEVWFTPSAEVMHFWGGYSAVSRRTTLWTAGSQLLFFQKHFQGWRGRILVGMKFFSLGIRCVVYAIVGVLFVRQSMLQKSGYYVFAFRQLLTGSWRYRHGFNGSVEPWPLV